MQDIYEYIQTSRENRTQHLDLTKPCSDRGGFSTEFRGLLAYYLDTSLPIKGHSRKIHLCHACGNGHCSNVNHLYWGTPKENFEDQKTHGVNTTITVRTRAKYGEDGVKAIAMLAGKNSGIAKRKPPEYWESFRSHFENVDLAQYGAVGKIAAKLDISSTSVRRIAKHLGILSMRASPRKNNVQTKTDSAE